jgi:hypothetical protein
MTKFTNICIQDVSDLYINLWYSIKNPINYALNFNSLSNVILLKKIKELEDKSTY